MANVISSKRIPVAYKTDTKGVFMSLTLDTRHAKFERGDSVPLAVRVSYDKGKSYFRTGRKFNSLDEYLSFVKARDSRSDRKKELEYFDMIKDVIENIVFHTKGKFTLERLSEEVKKGFKSDVNDTFKFWRTFLESKPKVKTRAMYEMGLARFMEFRKGKPIQLSDVTTEVIIKFSEWLEQQKCKDRHGNISDRPLSLDSRMFILRAARAVFNGAKKAGLIGDAPKFEIHVGNRRRENALTVEQVLKLWDYWKTLDAKGRQSASGRAVGRWLMLYALNGMNTIDQAKLIWQEKGSINERYPQLSFIRSKIDRANKPKGKKLDTTIVPIISQLRELLDEYASPYEVGAYVFPGIFGNATTDEARAIRVHDYNRRIGKNIAPVCEKLGLPRITPQWARNSFISALAHHGVMSTYIDFAVGHTTDDVTALLAGYIANINDETMAAYNEKIFIIPPIPQNLL